MQAFKQNHFVHKMTAVVKKHPQRSAVIVFCVLLAGLIYGTATVFAPSKDVPGANKSSNTDLSWFKLPGATHESQGVNIKPLGRAIVNQDGSGGQPNPPVNITGSHFDVSGDFEIYASFSNAAEGEASLQFYGSVPVIYDEWRLETPSFWLNIFNRSVTASVWDGSREFLVETRNFSTDGPFDSITVIHSGGQLSVFVNNKKIGSVSDHNVFSSGKIWVGADTKVGGPGWTLTGLHLSGVGKGSATLVAAPSYNVSHSNSQALRNLASSTGHELKIGVAIALGPLMTNDKYRNLAGSEFSMLTPENEMKAQFIHPLPDTYTFTEADALVDFAKANDMAVHGHALVFGEANPKWMQELPLTERKQRMIDHVTQIVSHYKDRVAEWDVVNEPLADNDSNDTSSSDMRNSIWYQAMGEQFIDEAFKAARTADPSAKLYLNEFGLEADGDRWDSLVSLVERLKSRSVPIDGIGFQSHVYETADHVDPAVLRAHIQQLAKMGLLSRISEMDVHGDNSQTQANEYAGVAGACAAEPTCTSFSSWGITDLYGSTTDIRVYPPSLGDDLIWDESFQPKPAYPAIQKALAK